MSKIKKIRSGGQTGVDRAALDAAKKNNVSICGWCPRDGWAEDMTNPPGLLKKYPELKETKSKDPKIRTEWNVRDSDATIIICPNNINSPGTTLTEKFAVKHNKSYIVINNDNYKNNLFKWLKNLPSNIDLNIAGPRLSEWDKAYNTTYTILNELIQINK